MHAFPAYGMPMNARSDNKRRVEVRTHMNKRGLSVQTPRAPTTRGLWRCGIVHEACDAPSAIRKGIAHSERKSARARGQ